MSRQTSLGWARVRQVCRAFGISRQAYYAAQRPKVERRLRRKSDESRVRRCATVAELEPKIRALVAQHPAWGVRKVWACLRRDGLHVSHKRVWALMRSWGLVLPPPAERDPSAPRGQVVVPTSNRRWSTDLTTVWTRRNGLAAVVPAIDCGDRCCLDIEVTKSQESPSVLAPVERAVEVEFGKPERVPDGLELRTDHGPQYTGADCETLCAKWLLDHTLAPVGRPTGNAVAERFILTMKQELIWTRDWDSIDELRAAVLAWVSEYNHVRPHQALAWRTPAEQRDLNLGRKRQAAA
jgi:transposase InsO family protein